MRDDIQPERADDIHRTLRGDDIPSLHEPPKLGKLASGNPYCGLDKNGAVKKLLSKRTRLVEKKSLVFLCRRSGKEGKKGARKKAVVEKSKNSC